MASDPNAPRSRRALLTAAAGGAAAVAASAALPLTTMAAPVNLQTEQDNPTVDTTSVTQSAAAHVAFKARTANTDAAGLVGSTGDESGSSDDTSWTGIYGWAPTNPDQDFFSAGVWGDSEDVGVYGFGAAGVLGDGDVGVVGRADLGGYGVHALNFDATGIALRVDGKAQFSRSGRKSIGTGKSSLKVTMPGVTSQSLVFAVLASNRSGRYVRAVVPTTGSFTIYLNTTLSSASWVAYFVVN
jgi:hypothetical protein